VLGAEEPRPGILLLKRTRGEKAKVVSAAALQWALEWAPAGKSTIEPDAQPCACHVVDGHTVAGGGRCKGRCHWQQRARSVTALLEIRLSSLVAIWLWLATQPVLWLATQPVLWKWVAAERVVLAAERLLFSAVRLCP
jgi:hypothetical protein